MGCASSVDGGKGFNKVAPAPKSTKNNADKNSNHISEPDFLPGQSALSTYVFFIFKVVSPCCHHAHWCLISLYSMR